MITHLRMSIVVVFLFISMPPITHGMQNHLLEEEICCLCLDSLDGNAPPSYKEDVFGCNHMQTMHNNCFIKMFFSCDFNNECPTCRTPLKSNFSMEYQLIIAIQKCDIDTLMNIVKTTPTLKPTNLLLNGKSLMQYARETNIESAVVLQQLFENKTQKSKPPTAKASTHSAQVAITCCCPMVASLRSFFRK